jgi:hypothetical protein
MPTLYCRTCGRNREGNVTTDHTVAVEACGTCGTFSVDVIAGKVPEKAPRPKKATPKAKAKPTAKRKPAPHGPDSAELGGGQ